MFSLDITCRMQHNTFIPLPNLPHGEIFTNLLPAIFFPVFFLAKETHVAVPYCGQSASSLIFFVSNTVLSLA